MLIPQTLKFVKQPNSACKNVVKANANTFKVDVKLSDMIWRLPIVKFNPILNGKILSEVAKGNEYEILFRHWFHMYTKNESQISEFIWDFPSTNSRVKYVLIAFQKPSRDGVLTEDYSTFDHCNLRSIQVQLNNARLYPHEKPASWNITEFRVGSLYTLFKDFQQSYYNRNEHETYPVIDLKTFLTKFPIVCIDCSRHYTSDTVIKDSVINIKIRFEFVTPLEVNTTVHAIIISEEQTRYLPLPCCSMT